LKKREAGDPTHDGGDFEAQISDNELNICVGPDSFSNKSIKNRIVISSSDDLPDINSNNRHPLEDNTAYFFDGFIDSPYGLEIGNSSPLIGDFGSNSGFIHTGGNTAIYSDGNPFFAREVYIHSPGGKLFDLKADNTTDMLVYNSSFSDASGLGNISNLGTIDGYRVPSFVGVNFEDFDAGLTFKNSSNKIYASGCIFREVNQGTVTVLDFDSSVDTDIVDLANNYVKNVQSDTKVVNFDSSATLGDIFQYRGNTHDSTVTKSNILNGDAGLETVGYRVKDSYPLRDSSVNGTMSFSDDSTIAISSQASSITDSSSYVKVTGNFSIGEEERTTLDTTDGTITYVGKRDNLAMVHANLSLGTGNTDEVALAVFKNGSIIESSITSLVMSGVANGVDKMMNIQNYVDSVTDDVFDVRVANLGSTTDVTVAYATFSYTNGS